MTPAKDRVLRVALRTFASRGYSGTSMRDLGTALGMAAPSIYSHVPTKQALLTGVMEPFAAGLERIALDAPAEEEGRARWLNELAGYLAEHPQQVAVMGDLGLWEAPEVQQRLSRTTEALHSALVKVGARDTIQAASMLGYLTAAIRTGNLPLLRRAQLVADLDVVLADLAVSVG